MIVNVPPGGCKSQLPLSAPQDWTGIHPLTQAFDVIEEAAGPYPEGLMRALDPLDDIA